MVVVVIIAFLAYKKIKFQMTAVTDITKLPYIYLVKENQTLFGKKVIEISYKLNILPQELMCVMYNETAGTMSSHIKNPTSSATGLIQFMAETAGGLGTSTAALAAMSNVDQLDYVYQYLLKYKGKMKDVSDIYLAVFFPAALYQSSEQWRFPQWAVDANPIFDINHDHTLTKAEFRQYVNNKFAAVLK